MDWLYNELNTQWINWVPKNESERIRYGAFYSVLVRPGFRLISMNMNYCYAMNWFVQMLHFIYLFF